MVNQKFDSLNYAAIASIISSMSSIYLSMLAFELRRSFENKKESKEFLTFEECHNKVRNIIEEVNEAVRKGLHGGVLSHIGEFCDGKIHYHNENRKIHVEIAEDYLHIFSNLTESEMVSIEYNVKHHIPLPD